MRRFFSMAANGPQSSSQLKHLCFHTRTTFRSLKSIVIQARCVLQTLRHFLHWNRASKFTVDFRHRALTSCGRSPKSSQISATVASQRRLATVGILETGPQPSVTFATLARCAIATGFGDLELLTEDQEWKRCKSGPRKSVSTRTRKRLGNKFCTKLLALL